LYQREPQAIPGEALTEQKQKESRNRTEAVCRLLIYNRGGFQVAATGAINYKNVGIEVVLAV